ncbi:MAG: hypothetical protein U0263_22095 [Polyangiaceae bacterium]
MARRTRPRPRRGLDAPARAQTVIQKNNIDRNVGFRSNNKKMWVSHSDCAADDFVDLTGFSGEVARESLGRHPTAPSSSSARGQATCWKPEAFPNKTTINVKVRAQGIVAKKVKPGGAGGGAGRCDNTDVATSGEAVTLFFMLLDSNDAAVASEVTDTPVFRHPPPAPTGIRRASAKWW